MLSRLSSWLQEQLETGVSSANTTALVRTLVISSLRYIGNALTLCRDIQESLDPVSCGVVVVLALCLVVVIGPVTNVDYKVD